MWVPPLGWEDPLEEGMATHSSILAWRIPWTEEPRGQWSTVSQRVRHDKRFGTSAKDEKLSIWISLSIKCFTVPFRVIAHDSKFFCYILFLLFHIAYTCRLKHVSCILLSWPKSLFKFFDKVLCRNPNELFGQPNVLLEVMFFIRIKHVLRGVLA